VSKYIAKAMYLEKPKLLIIWSGGRLVIIALRCDGM
jgi:hypothetical protein